MDGDRNVRMSAPLGPDVGGAIGSEARVPPARADPVADTAELSALFDGELDPVRARKVEAIIASDAGLRAGFEKGQPATNAAGRRVL